MYNLLLGQLLKHSYPSTDLKPFQVFHKTQPFLNHRIGEAIFHHYPAARRLSKEEENDVNHLVKT